MAHGDTESVKCLRGYLWITIKGEVTAEKTKELLNAWYRAHAIVVFQDRLLACHQKTERKGVPMPKLRIRRMVSRWGSFSSHGGVTLNLLLITTPKECIDYVILHELCHFKIKRHGPGFWRLLESLMSDYKERRKKLNACA